MSQVKGLEDETDQKYFDAGGTVDSRFFSRHTFCYKFHLKRRKA